MDRYHYRLKSLRESSDKYGPCQVCGKHTSEMFLQVEMKEFEDEEGKMDLTCHKCRDLFGHEECLRAKQR